MMKGKWKQRPKPHRYRYTLINLFIRNRAPSDPNQTISRRTDGFLPLLPPIFYSVAVQFQISICPICYLIP